MILAAGLTPAWQQILRFDAFQVGEVNRALEAHWCGSGKVLNVGLALQQLGAECRTLTFLGGLPRTAILEEFTELGVDGRWLMSAAPTRVCTTILDAATGRSTELVENAVPLTAGELKTFRELYAAEAAEAQVVVLSGSLPAGTPVDYYADLLRDTPGRVILDARGAELEAALAERPFAIKPNWEELERTLGRPLHNDADLCAALDALHARGAVWIVITRGADAVWVSGPGQRHRLYPPTVSVVNPIGCGDCLAAGLAAALDRGAEFVDAVRYGIASAAENARHLLPARLTPAAVNALLPQVRQESVPVL